MSKSTPNKLRGKNVLKVLKDHDYNTKRAAEYLGVSTAAIYGWLRANGCKRTFVCVDGGDIAPKRAAHPVAEGR